MVIFSLLFLYIYRTREYIFKKGASAVPLGHGGYQGGLLGFRAYGQALNILDILQGVLSIPRAIAIQKTGRKEGEFPTDLRVQSYPCVLGNDRVLTRCIV